MTHSLESDNLLPQQGFRNSLRDDPQHGDNDTSALNAYRHWVARHKHGESAVLFVEIRQIGIMTLFQKRFGCCSFLYL